MNSTGINPNQPAEQHDNREAFLARIAQRLGRPTPKVAPRLHYDITARQLQGDVVALAHADSLMDLFIQRFESQGGTAIYANSLADIAKVLQDNIAKQNLKHAVAWDDERIAKLGMSNVLRDAGLTVTDNPMEAEVGITFAEWAIAETGTIAVNNGPRKARAVSLVPNTYIAFVTKEAIVPTLDYVLTDMGQMGDAGALPSCVNLIAGPSSSADIELELVVGIHGPTFVTVVILGDELSALL